MSIISVNYTKINGKKKQSHFLKMKKIVFLVSQDIILNLTRFLKALLS